MAFLSFVGAAVGIAVPIMVDKKPGEVAAAITPWLPLIYAVSVLLLMYGAAAVAYEKGRAEGSKVTAVPITTPPNAVPQPNRRSIKDLTYAANQIASILMEQGNLRMAALEAKFPTLERDHDVWHDDEARVARNDLMEIVRFCSKMRAGNGPSIMAGIGVGGDFTQNERAEYGPAIERRRDRLVTRLRELDH